MACTPETFKVRFPEFASVDDLRIEMFLEDATEMMGSQARWCASLYDKAKCYLAAHLLAEATIQEDGDSGVIGPVSKQAVDDVVIEQEVNAATAKEGIFGTTSYGKRYVHYRHICFGAYIIGV